MKEVFEVPSSELKCRASFAAVPTAPSYTTSHFTQIRNLNIEMYREKDEI